MTTMIRVALLAIAAVVAIVVLMRPSSPSTIPAKAWTQTGTNPRPRAFNREDNVILAKRENSIDIVEIGSDGVVRQVKP